MSDENASQGNPQILLRDPRFVSHALIEVRKSKWLPMNVFSAVLLDISVGGVKIELTGDKPLKPGESYWLSIPLAPLQIYAPEKLICQMEVRWFDNDRFRCGGSLRDLPETSREIIERIIFNMSAHRQQRESASA